MSPLPASALVSSGQIVERSGASLAQGGQRAFIKVQGRVGGQQETASPHTNSRPQYPGTALPSGINPSTAQVLAPKLEHVRGSLQTLNARIAASNPPANVQPLRNRLQALETQFQSVGDNLQQSAVQRSPLALLKLQNDIYQIGEQVELLSKAVDQATNGVKSIMQTQI